jgi:hypothetical protein
VTSDCDSVSSTDIFTGIIDQTEEKFPVKVRSLRIQFATARDAEKDAMSQVIYGTDGIFETVLGHKFFITPKTFSQGNPYTCDLLYQNVTSVINHLFQKMDSSYPTNLICYGRNVGHICFPFIQKIKDEITDGYCHSPCQMFVPLTESLKVVFDKIYGFNPCQFVHQDLMVSLKANDLENVSEFNLECTLDCQKIINHINYLDDTMNHLLIVSPGRSGLNKSLAKSIGSARDKLKSFIYVSCSMDTLIRDLDVIGGCQLIFIQPIDLFPGTEMCELIVEIGLEN